MAAMLISISLVTAIAQVAAERPAPAAAAPGSPVTALAFSPDGRSLLVGSQRGLEVRSWPSLAPMPSIDVSLESVHDFAFSSDGRLLAVAGGTPGQEGLVEVFSLPDARRLYQSNDHFDVNYSVAFSPDGKLWAAASLDATVSLHRAGDGKLLALLEGHSRGVKAVTFLPDGQALVTAGIDQTLRVWTIGTQTAGAQKDGAPSVPERTSRAPTVSAPIIRAPGDEGDTDAAPMISAQMVRALTNHTQTVHDLALRPLIVRAPTDSAPNHRPALPLIASVSDDRTIRLWQPTIGRMVRFNRLEGAVPLAVRWTADGARMLVACDDGRVRLLDPDTAAVVSTLPALEGWAYSLAVHPKGREIAVGGAGGVRRVVLPE